MADNDSISDNAEKAYAAAAAEKIDLAPQPIVAEPALPVLPEPVGVEAPLVGISQTEAPKPIVAKKSVTPRKAAKPAEAASPVVILGSDGLPLEALPAPKDTNMAEKTKKTAEELTAKAKDAVKDAQTRAKAAFEKNKTVLSDAGEFVKGNIVAIRESGKILASGVKVLGKTVAVEAKSEFGVLKEDVKELRAVVKSPKAFVKLQGTILRKHFDTAKLQGSKNGKAVRQLASEAIQPISHRVNLVVEKVKKAA